MECPTSSVTRATLGGMPATPHPWAPQRRKRDVMAALDQLPDGIQIEYRILNTNHIGRVLRRVREEQRLSQALAAQCVGILQTHLSDLEHGKRSIKPELLVRLATFYGITLDTLCGRDQAA